jgi:hypothetical protein
MTPPLPSPPCLALDTLTPHPQGISSKVKQTAAATLGQLLPPEARGSLLPFIRVSGGSTELAPHAGLAAGSTTSEGATAATAAACDELVGRLRGSAEALEKDGKEVTWQAVVKGVCSPWEIITPKVRAVSGYDLNCFLAGGGDSILVLCECFKALNRGAAKETG